ncbi:MAG TPA: Fur family transcriptional regulator [Pyrinomonadaceae bacterium]|jgi:Fur family ferric uptake transcriptional regulator/Fur family peroxide stress response transcriptional regulator
MADKVTRDDVETRLREAEMRLTPQRFAVLEYLTRAAGHPTADQIAGEINRRFPRASRATVYNTLGALRAAGLVREVLLDGEATRYESNIEPHHHFVCRACGRLEDVPHEAFAAPARVELGGGQEVETVEVVLRGLCAACRRKG